MRSGVRCQWMQSKESKRGLRGREGGRRLREATGGQNSRDCSAHWNSISLSTMGYKAVLVQSNVTCNRCHYGVCVTHAHRTTQCNDMPEHTDFCCSSLIHKLFITSPNSQLCIDTGQEGTSTQQCSSAMDCTGPAVGFAVLNLEVPCFFFLVGPERAAARPASGLRPLVNAFSITSPAALLVQLTCVTPDFSQDRYIQGEAT